MSEQHFNSAGCNPYLVQSATEMFVIPGLQEGVTFVPRKVLCVTFNVNKLAPDSKELERVLRKLLTRAAGKAQDGTKPCLVCVVLEEMFMHLASRVRIMVSGKKEKDFDKEMWNNYVDLIRGVVKKSLPGYAWKPVRETSCTQKGLCLDGVFVYRATGLQHNHWVAGIEQALDLGGVFEDKSAIVCPLQLVREGDNYNEERDPTLYVVGAHLPANFKYGNVKQWFQQAYHARIQAMAKIFRATKVLSGEGHTPVLIIGDLNFRNSKNSSTFEDNELTSTMRNRLNKLIEEKYLVLDKEEKETVELLQACSEGTFNEMQPTFKYDNSGKRDNGDATLSKNRPPSFTDRVLMWNPPTSMPMQWKFGNYIEVLPRVRSGRGSDHAGVSVAAEFQLVVDVDGTIDVCRRCVFEPDTADAPSSW